MCFLPDRFIVLLSNLTDALSFNLRSVVNQQSLKLQALRQQEVSNVVSSDGDVVEGNGLSTLDSQLHSLQMRVH